MRPTVQDSGMTSIGYTLVLSSAALMAASNMLIKHGVDRAGQFALSLRYFLRIAAQPTFIAGFLMAGAAAVLWIQVLSTQKLSVCYPVFVSLTYGLVTIGAVFFFREPISLQRLAGLAAMVLGIVFVSRG
jgi:multidrug transporter EmrE-like cation transporter